MFKCDFCIRTFETKLGKSNHNFHCPKNPNRKVKRSEDAKKCVCCEKIFQPKVQSQNRKVQVTCSIACSNTYFRTGGERIDNHYRTICFRHHPKICVACNETNIVEVHHYDGDHFNNDPSNLVPLCPTHHKYVHSRFKYLVNEKIDTYVQDFVKYCSEVKCLL